MKKCTKCQVLKPKSEFYSDSRKKDGLRSWCKMCQKEDNKKREPKYNEYRRQYRKDHTDKVRENKREYYKENKNHLLANAKVWRQQQSGRLHSYKMSAKNRGIKWNLTKEEFLSFWQLPCIYCNSSIDTIGIDRIDSTKDYVIDNVVPCCSVCNKLKMDLPKDIFINQIKKIYEWITQSDVK